MRQGVGLASCFGREDSKQAWLVPCLGFVMGCDRCQIIKRAMSFLTRCKSEGPPPARPCIRAADAPRPSYRRRIPSGSRARHPR